MEIERINKIKKEITTDDKFAKIIYDDLMYKSKKYNTSFDEELEKYKEKSKNRQGKNLFSFFVIIIIIILITSFIIGKNIISNKNINIINNSFNTIVSDESNNSEIKKAIKSIEEKVSDIDCVKALTDNNKYYNICMNYNNYVQYAKAKIIFNDFPKNPDYDDYNNLYNALDDSSYDYSYNEEKYMNLKNTVLNGYYNFLVDKVLDGDYERVIEVSEVISGREMIQYSETRYNDKNYCTSFSDESAANIYYFALSFDDNIEPTLKYNYYWNNIDYDDKNEYDKKILNYVSEQLSGNEMFLNNNKVVNKEEYKKALLLGNPSRPTKLECDKLLEKSNELNQIPKIGMTKAQVLNGKWGTPQKINKTTTIYGTREQWVYSGYRYVYFDEDGFVTTIQN